MTAVAGTAGGAKSAPQFSIRGQSQQERGGLADPSVGVYFGDVVIARTQGLNQGLFDITDVGVIRGPAGTLCGKNATGGAVIRSDENMSELQELMRIPNAVFRLKKTISTSD